jgi:hypothetical protein
MSWLQGSLILRAAPTLLAMDPGTLAVKVQRLELLAQKHPKWAEVRRHARAKKIYIIRNV